MRHNPDKLQEFIMRLMGKRNMRSLVITLSAVVVFVTTYLLILPAITLDKDEAIQQGGIDVAIEQTVDETADDSVNEPADEAPADTAVQSDNQSSGTASGEVKTETGAAGNEQAENQDAAGNDTKDAKAGEKGRRSC